jgi:hypothetical protein
MTVKKPLVITGGQIEQLQSGDTLDMNNTVNRVFNSAATIGQPVYSVSGTNVDLAQANAQGTIRVIGLTLSTAVNAANPGDVLIDGKLTATTTQWDAVTGQSGGLTPGVNYFLNPANPGQLTVTAPSTVGEFVVRVGYALSATEFEIEIGQPIKL